MIRESDEFIERRIITGLIVSTDFLDRVRRIWDSSLLESQELRTVANWCIEYYDKYKRAPDSDIETIYVENEPKLSKADARYIEEMLASLSDEYGRGSKFNAPYLYDKTVQYLKARELERHNREVQALIDAGRVEEAERLAASYSPRIMDEAEVGIELSSQEALERVERAFIETNQSVLSYPGALGRLWNEHLTRGAFFTLLAPEKRGKSFFMIDMALRAVRQKANVALFIAGDMTEAQVLRRICVYIARRSDREKYCGERFRAVGDCVLNQTNECDLPARNCDHGIFEDLDATSYQANVARIVTLDTLRDKYEEFPEYQPCDVSNCPARIGTVWLEKVDAVRPLTAEDAKTALQGFFRRYRRRLRLSTHPAGTLTVTDIRGLLDDWERRDGFVPDVIIIDYADLLSADDSQIKEFRHRQDHIWRSLRALSQERHVLLITATQADAESYRKGRLSMENFSEDKRKLAHVTAQFGLNQDPGGREKRLGILRVNEIVVREGTYDSERDVTVLQDLAIGRAFTGSF